MASVLLSLMARNAESNSAGDRTWRYYSDRPRARRDPLRLRHFQMLAGMNRIGQQRDPRHGWEQLLHEVKPLSVQLDRHIGQSCEVLLAMCQRIDKTCRNGIAAEGEDHRSRFDFIANGPDGWPRRHDNRHVFTQQLLDKAWQRLGHAQRGTREQGNVASIDVAEIFEAAAEPVII
jgi:hypothetical protein